MVWLSVLSHRISGNAASDRNIHSSVSEQLKKNFAKSRWKVKKENREHVFNIFTLIVMNIIYIFIQTTPTSTTLVIFFIINNLIL